MQRRHFLFLLQHPVTLCFFHFFLLRPFVNSNPLFDFKLSIDKSDEDISKNIKTGKLYTLKSILSKLFSVKTCIHTNVTRKPYIPQAGFIRSGKLGREA